MKKMKKKNEKEDPELKDKESEESLEKEIKGIFKEIFEKNPDGKAGDFKIAKDLKERLSDVKGMDEVKDEINEIIQMLQKPDKYENAGAKLIRGILLVGKPGTGKTLLARALAGESNVNFIYCNASEFDKSFVGQGDRLLKNLFETAKSVQPCIIFIDEIDTLLHKGRRSG
jgi:cell division protease FtsH